jgi:hypothetical protein
MSQKITQRLPARLLNPFWVPPDARDILKQATQQEKPIFLFIKEYLPQKVSCVKNIFLDDWDTPWGGYSCKLGA